MVFVRDEVRPVVFHDFFAVDGRVAGEDDVVVRIDMSGVVVAGCDLDLAPAIDVRAFTEK